MPIESCAIESTSCESTSVDRSLRARARIHAALGDPVRLAVTDTLWLGDASPGEIAHDLRMPTNLVAHHVQVLVDAGLVRRTRSQADRRRTYLRLRPGALDVLAVPDLPAAARVVFVGTHDRARAPLAAALWTQLTGRPAVSTGTRPVGRVHPGAATVARRHGLRLRATGTAGAAAVLTDADLVVAVCDGAHEQLGGASGARLHWSVPDPVGDSSDEAFEAAYADLRERIRRLAPTGTADG